MQYKWIFNFLLIIHITCGFAALINALGAMFSAKGQSRHRLFGRGFFYAMTGVFITAIPLSIIIRNLFLFLIAIFSYYLALSGWRFAQNRSGIPIKLDWIVSAIMLIASFTMLGLGIFYFNTGSFESTVLFVFGGIGGLTSLTDLKAYRDRSAVSKQRIVQHLTAMLGATIAALTAFSVTNFTFQPVIILWLAPIVMLVPIIILWKYKVMNTNFIK